MNQILHTDKTEYFFSSLAILPSQNINIKQPPKIPHGRLLISFITS